jgi:RNA polymerase sigma-70 factor, ECF subfamily
MRYDFPGLAASSFVRQLAPPRREGDIPAASNGERADRSTRPPSEEPTDHSLIGRSRAGDQNAATRLYARYAKRLTGLVRRRCPAHLARAVGVEDIVQSVFSTLFQRISKGFYDVPDGAELWKLIFVIALNKIRAKATYHQALKRDANRAAPRAAARRRIALQEISDGPASEQLELALKEILDRLPAENRLMAQLRIDGYKVSEVAAMTGRSRRSVERILQETRVKLTELLEQEG